jgi:hypothetical protein
MGRRTNHDGVIAEAELPFEEQCTSSGMER